MPDARTYDVGTEMYCWFNGGHDMTDFAPVEAQGYDRYESKHCRRCGKGMMVYRGADESGPSATREVRDPETVHLGPEGSAS